MFASLQKSSSSKPLCSFQRNYPITRSIRSEQLKTLEDQREFLKELAVKLKLNSFEDWYHVSLSKIQKNGGAPMLVKYTNSIANMLQTVFPEYPNHLKRVEIEWISCWRLLHICCRFN
jgi:hypothetical protein